MRCWGSKVFSKLTGVGFVDHVHFYCRDLHVIVKLSECKLKPQRDPEGDQIVCIHIITILSFGFSSINMCLQQIETNAVPIQSYLQIALRRIYVSIVSLHGLQGFLLNLLHVSSTQASALVLSNAAMDFKEYLQCTGQSCLHALNQIDIM